MAVRRVALGAQGVISTLPLGKQKNARPDKRRKPHGP